MLELPPYVPKVVLCNLCNRMNARTGVIGTAWVYESIRCATFEYSVVASS